MKLQDKLRKINTAQVLPIITQNSKKKHLLLDKVTKCIEIPYKQIECLKKTATKSGYCSLSSVQIGIQKAFFVIGNELQEEKWKKYEDLEFKAYINPKIVEESKYKYYNWECCSSYPFQYAKVQRAYEIYVEYRNEKNKQMKESLEGFRARVFQHEYDHLFGLTIQEQSQNIMYFNLKGITKEELKENCDYFDQEKLKIEYLDKFIDQHNKKKE